jgi:hypothetical protein
MCLLPRIQNENWSRIISYEQKQFDAEAESKNKNLSSDFSYNFIPKVYLGRNIPEALLPSRI